MGTGFFLFLPPLLTNLVLRVKGRECSAGGDSSWAGQKEGAVRTIAAAAALVAGVAFGIATTTDGGPRIGRER